MQWNDVLFLLAMDQLFFGGATCYHVDNETPPFEVDYDRPWYGRSRSASDNDDLCLSTTRSPSRSPLPDVLPFPPVQQERARPYKGYGSRDQRRVINYPVFQESEEAFGRRGS